MLLALATLVLLPGLLVVRAPWTAVPALSLAFWALSSWWPLLASASRGRVLLAALLVFGTLLALRFLPKHDVEPPPGTPPRRVLVSPPGRGLPPPPLLCVESAVVLAAALAVALPGLSWRNAPGPAAAFQTTAARLYLWRDAIPANLEPLLPLAPFGAHAPALATLAGDLARLSGADPAPALAVLLAAAAAAALLGLYALHAAWRGPRAAAVGAVLGLALAPWPRWLSPWGAAEAVLALAFLLPACALLAAHRSRASAVAAGFLFAAGALAQPALALTAFLASALVALWLPAAAPEGARCAAARRVALVAGSTVAFGLPGLWPLARALSFPEAVAVAVAVRPADAAWFAAGLAAILFAPAAAAPLARKGGRVAAAAAALGALLLVARVHGWMAAGQLALRDEALLRRTGSEPGLEPRCAPDRLRDWVPAIAARPAGEPGPWIAPEYADEFAARARGDCAPLAGDIVSPGRGETKEGIGRTNE